MRHPDTAATAGSARLVAGTPRRSRRPRQPHHAAAGDGRPHRRRNGAGPGRRAGRPGRHSHPPSP